MATQIKCPHCNKPFEPTDAYKHELEGKLVKQAEQKAESKLKREFELSIKSLKESESDERDRAKKLQEQILDLTKELRSQKREVEDAKLDMQKQLAKEEDKIREDAEKKITEREELKIAEKEKQLQDAIKANEDLRRKLVQGSQQTQGEVLELEIEDILKKEFPEDKITEVKKGQRGADVVQEVVDKKGRNCGTILWEIKNAKWQAPWVNKLKADQRVAKADSAVLVVTEAPKEIKTFSYDSGIWIAKRDFVKPLAFALRYTMIKINHEKSINVGKNEKMEVLFAYINSTEFKHRIEAIVESFDEMQSEMEREKRWFNTKWARQEKHLRKVLDNTHGMYGDLQGVVGKSLPEIKTLQIEGNE